MRNALLLAVLVPSLAGADFADVNPNVFPADDPRSKELPRMMQNDVKRRMQEANLRESKAFAAVQTKEQWEAYRDVRIKALRESLGTFPPVPANMRTVVTGSIVGDGFVIQNVVYESRPGLWVSANLYLPAKPPAKMPGLIISHAHHTPKTQSELQDMGMTWARAGSAVLVPDHLGHGERRQHDFVTEADYPKPFRPSRQDYYFRYNSNLQLSACGESLIGWMVWDLMRGIDVLLKQPNIDASRIILLGAVAGGGDPAGVTAALDPRIACVVPFNFSGWQPESNAPPDPDRDFAWFGEGYWESTRGLKGGAAGGFAHYVITGSIAPRKLLYAHEFKWDPNIDPAWPRLQKIYGFYDAKDRLSFAHGAGKVSGPSGPDNTHCTHIGAVHRRMIYPAFKQWFDMPIPEEYSQPRKREELMCWTEAAKKELGPKKLHEVLINLADAQLGSAVKKFAGLKPEQSRELLRKDWARLLGDVEPVKNPKVIEGKAEDVPGGRLSRFALETEPGIVVPLLYIAPKNTNGKLPVVVMIAQAGKSAFLKERGEAIAAFLKAGVAVCLVDLRGTGESKPGTSADRSSSRTTISQTYLILGQPLLGAQLRDLRTVIRWIQARDDVNEKKFALWGDSFAKLNPADFNPAVPHDAPDLPLIGEPGMATLALFAPLYEDAIDPVMVYGKTYSPSSVFSSPYVYVPHDSVIPGMTAVAYTPAEVHWPLDFAKIDGVNRRRGFDNARPEANVAADLLIAKLKAK